LKGRAFRSHKSGELLDQLMDSRLLQKKGCVEFERVCAADLPRRLRGE